MINNKLFLATKWSFITELSAKLIVPITNIILARLLVPEEFGIMAMINMIISFCEIFTSGGFEQFLIHKQFKTKEEEISYISVAFYTNLFISFFIVILISLFLNDISIFLGGLKYRFYIIVASINLILTSFISIPIAILQKNYEYKFLFKIRVLTTFSQFLISVILAYKNFGVWSLILSLLISNMLKIFILKPNFNLDKKYSLKKLKLMFEYSFWILLEGIMFWLSSWIDILIISKYLNGYYIGLFKNSQIIVTGIISLITASINTIFFTYLCEEQNNLQKFKEIYYFFQKRTAIIIFPLGVAIFIFREIITKILLGSNWNEASLFLGYWGFCMGVVACFGTFSREALKAKGLTKYAMLSQLTQIISIIIITYISVQKSFYFLSIFRSIIYIQVLIPLYYYVNKYCSISPIKIFRENAPIILASTIMGCFGYIYLKFFQNFYLQILGMLICASMYFVILLMFKEYKKIVVKFILDNIK